MSISTTPTKTLFSHTFPPLEWQILVVGQGGLIYLESSMQRQTDDTKGRNSSEKTGQIHLPAWLAYFSPEKPRHGMGREAGSGEGSRKQVGSSSLPFTGVGWEVLDLGMWLFLCTLPSQVPDLCVSDLNMSFSSSHQNVWCPSEHL